LRNELIRKNCEAQVLQDEIKRLKGKVNAAATAQQEFAKNKEMLLEENKMLLAEILFLKK
jgi:FtsZ-binding cell division protein ZapB